MAVTQVTGQVATAAVNEVTGNRLVTRAPTDAYKEGWDRIFGKKKQQEEPIADGKPEDWEDVEA